MLNFLLIGTEERAPPVSLRHPLLSVSRARQPSFHFDQEAGYGPGVDREAWESIAEDLVVPVPPSPSPSSWETPGSASRGREGVAESEAFFVPVDGGMASYCPRDLRGGGRGEAGVGGSGGGGGGCRRAAIGKGWREEEEDLRVFELLGIIIGANLGWNKVRLTYVHFVGHYFGVIGRI